MFKFKIRTLIIIVSFVCVRVQLAYSQSEDLNFQRLEIDISSKGYHEFLDKKNTHEDRFGVYQRLKKVFEHIAANKEDKEQLELLTCSFKKTEQYKQFGNAPVGFIDGSKSGKSNKNYIHFNDDYWAFLEQHKDKLERIDEFNELMLGLRDISITSREVMRQAILRFPDLSMEVKKDLSENFLLITKVVHYKGGEDFLSHPHYDFSAFTIMLHNSDDSVLRIAPPQKEPINWSSYKNIDRKMLNSSIFLPGRALKIFGLSKNDGTSHAVLPSEKERFATILFAMIPYKEIDYSQIRTKVNYNN